MNIRYIDPCEDEQLGLPISYPKNVKTKELSYEVLYSISYNSSLVFQAKIFVYDITKVEDL